MAQVDTVLRDFILNVLSDEEFQKLAEKDGNQLYFTDLIEYYTKEEARALMTLFRGQFADWASVPTSIANYASDFAGSKTPTQNNFMVVKDASGYATDACDILSHVQSTGTQYINLGIIPTVGMKYVASFQASNTTTGTIFGTDGCDMHVYQGDKNPVTEVNIGTSTLNTIGVSSGFDINYELTVKEKGVVSKASNITLSNPYSGELPTTEMYLFAKNTADVATGFSACIVKGFKVYEGETLLMDLVPARRVLDGAIGFMDITTNVFYENLGADPLIAGNVVSGGETPTDINGSWMFIYNGKWNENGKSGWTPAFALGGSGGGSGDGYSKAEIDNKILVINESIDAQADAIAKTRDDMNEKDSELESMLNAHATELSTLRGNQASLGDQVSGIEAKIPESASETNPLITKQQLLDEEMDIRDDYNGMISELQTQITAQAGAIAGKQEKLTAGDGISIVDNVISATAATAINYDNITNCITEIPQDIKLELANGVLTLKAGSKIYVPNGAGVFDAEIVNVDIPFTLSVNNTYMLFKQQGKDIIDFVPKNRTYSGATMTYENDNIMWYDTQSNSCGLYLYDDKQSLNFARNESFPICIFTVSNGAISSIDQVFNGFGYIGSTVFVLPGVKGLVPNRRNDDGTLKNALKTTTNVSVYTVSTPANHEYQLAYNGTIAPFYSHMTYNAEENINYNASGTTSTWGIVGSVKFNNNVISELNPKTAFHAVDYNDWKAETDALKNTITISTPAGMVSPFAGKTAPSGWLKCDGSVVSRTTYASLFAAIGTMYGAGDGSTTFNLPNLVGYLPLGMDTSYIGQVTNGVVPNILGEFYTRSVANPSGAFYYEESTASNPAGTGSAATSVARVAFNASRYNSIYGNGWFSGTRVIPASVGMTYCIKY